MGQDLDHLSVRITPQGSPEHSRKRESAWQVAASVALHVILFLLLPSLVTYSTDTPILELNIVKPGRAIPAARASTGTPSPTQISEQSSAKAEANLPVEQQPRQQPDASVKQAEAPAKEDPADKARSEADAASKQTAPSAANQSTSVVRPDPIVVKQNPQDQVPAKTPEPAEVKPQPPVEQKTEPVKQDDQKSDAKPQQPDSSGNGQKQDPVPPKQEDAKPAPAKDSGSTPGSQPGQPSGNADKPEGNSPGPGGEDDETKPADGVGQNPLPPGPTQAEMDLMKGYGDNARRRIKMLSRTPEVAREKGYKGSVKFEFEVNQNGSLKAVKIVNSSGYPVLDEECIEATRVAAPFGKFPAAVTMKTWKFEMTLKFPIT